MAQQGRAVPLSLETCLIPGTYMVEGAMTLKVVLSCPHMYFRAHTHLWTCVHTHKMQLKQTRKMAQLIWFLLLIYHLSNQFTETDFLERGKCVFFASCIWQKALNKFTLFLIVNNNIFPCLHSLLYVHEKQRFLQNILN